MRRKAQEGAHGRAESAQRPYMHVLQCQRERVKALVRLARTPSRLRTLPRAAVPCMHAM